jgi:hypothetical protein
MEESSRVAQTDDKVVFSVKMRCNGQTKIRGSGPTLEAATSDAMAKSAMTIDELIEARDQADDERNRLRDSNKETIADLKSKLAAEEASFARTLLRLDMWKRRFAILTDQSRLVSNDDARPTTGPLIGILDGATVAFYKSFNVFGPKQSAQLYAAAHTILGAVADFSKSLAVFAFPSSIEALEQSSLTRCHDNVVLQRFYTSSPLDQVSSPQKSTEDVCVLYCEEGIVESGLCTESTLESLYARNREFDKTIVNLASSYTTIVESQRRPSEPTMVVVTHGAGDRLLCQMYNAYFFRHFDTLESFKKTYREEVIDVQSCLATASTAFGHDLYRLDIGRVCQ